MRSARESTPHRKPTLLDNAAKMQVNIVTEIAYTTPHVLDGRIHEVMGR